jgi:hypothetical protein
MRRGSHNAETRGDRLTREATVSIRRGETNAGVRDEVEWRIPDGSERRRKTEEDKANLTSGPPGAEQISITGQEAVTMTTAMDDLSAADDVPRTTSVADSTLRDQAANGSAPWTRRARITVICHPSIGAGYALVSWNGSPRQGFER